MTKGIGKEFMEKTQYRFSGKSDQMKGLPQPPLELAYGKTKPVIDLPKPNTIKIKDIGLREAIENRRSIREYSEAVITLSELSFILWCTQGVKEVIDRPVTLRNVPSAGARHAFETYVLVNRVEGLQSGLYRFLAIDHQLVVANLEKDIADKITEACWKQEMVRNSAVTLIWVAVVYRMMWRYQERGYRYLHIDAGHVCQNLYLAAENINCGVCAIGAFQDEELNGLLGIDGVEQFVIYLGTLGKL